MSLHLTKRATWDLMLIHQRSMEEWGEMVAEKCLRGIEETMKTIERYPNILRKSPNISKHFYIYPYKSHWLVCDKAEHFIFVLTVRYAGINLENIVQELTPSLQSESKELHEMLVKSNQS